MKRIDNKKYSLWQVVLMLTVAFVGIGLVSYAAVMIPNTFTAGTTISSSQVNQNFNVLSASMPAVKSATVSSVLISLPTSTSEITSSDVITLTVTTPADGNMYLSANGFGLIGWCTVPNSNPITAMPLGLSLFEPSTANIVSSRTNASFAISAVFPATQGQHTYILRGVHQNCYDSGMSSVPYTNLQDIHMTAIFIPNSLP